MRVAAPRVLLALAACVTLLTGCESWQKTVSSWTAPKDGAAPLSSDPFATGSIPDGPSPNVTDALLGSDPNDDLSLGKRHYREQNYGLAEKHFRRAVEKLPRDGEAWLGLAASYDKLRRFELADRAYQEALRIFGRRPEVLNNIGYSYLLRGDFRQARIKLSEALAKDPNNPQIQNNIELLEESQRRAKGLR